MMTACRKCGSINCLCSSQRRRRLWLGGLSESMSECDVQSIFPSSVAVEIRRHQFSNGQGYAFVTFGNEEIARSEFENFNQRQLPYRHLKCRRCVWTKKVETDNNQNTEKEGRISIITLDCEKDGMPTLLAQLSPLSESEIRRRLETFGNPSSPKQERMAYETGGRVGKKKYLLEKLESLYRMGVAKRNLKYMPGIGKPIRAELVQTLLLELRRNIIWGKQKKKSRKGVDSEYYMVLGKKAQDSPFQIKKQHKQLWNLAMICLKEALGDDNYSCTSLAVTKNFRGSPHLDRMDTTFQFAASFGEADGKLCIEQEGQHEICIISTQNKVVKVDGRFIHWVKDYGAKERFSLIWFCLDSETSTEPVRAVHEDFVI
mmetsp:Transcript_22631/g.34186  ORF Transcript_22631/g.34186 Transcript_22631/m.34186 type:complete len:373 (-) Transcript_22631:72-1190(-)